MNPSTPLRVLQEPCRSCPYRRDTPPGIWAASEYAKLLRFSPGGQEIPEIALFLCHRSPYAGQSVCRGWLTVEADSVAVRLALIVGRVTPAQVAAPVKAPLYATGKEAARAGRRGVAAPCLRARATIERLERLKRLQKSKKAP